MKQKKRIQTFYRTFPAPLMIVKMRTFIFVKWNCSSDYKAWNPLESSDERERDRERDEKRGWRWERVGINNYYSKADLYASGQLGNVLASRPQNYWIFVIVRKHWLQNYWIYIHWDIYRRKSIALNLYIIFLILSTINLKNKTQLQWPIS